MISNTNPYSLESISIRWQDSRKRNLHHLTSRILHLASCILHLASCILHLTSYFSHLASCTSKNTSSPIFISRYIEPLRDCTSSPLHLVRNLHYTIIIHLIHSFCEKHLPLTMAILSSHDAQRKLAIYIHPRPYFRDTSIIDFISNAPIRFFVSLDYPFSFVFKIL
eukprot:TRINITY_DN4214_c0_g1_i6.p1 TRINITY_DN4214_c0_g1~~TRINITY_DN4214_c0_g1_i6.p1  ORF type:complete len:166 (+),score=28.77 TRINITY_DN4214_c0_g1_i6:215-712(+)